ncbi:hypothetical protein [Fusobacterium varium]
MGLKFTKGNVNIDIPFRNVAKEEDFLVFNNSGNNKFIDLTTDITKTAYTNIKVSKNNIVKYLKTKYVMDNVLYEPEGYIEGSGSPETSISNEFTFNLEGGNNIIVAFLYDLYLEHWGYMEIFRTGGYVAGTPIVDAMTSIYTPMEWEVRDPIMPVETIDTTSLETIKNTSTFYFTVNVADLNSVYTKVWTKAYQDFYGHRTTNLNYYLKNIDGVLYLKEEFEFATGKNKWNHVIIKRKYKYVISNYD